MNILERDNEKFSNNFFNHNNVSYYQDFSLGKSAKTSRERTKRHLGDPLVDKKKLFSSQIKRKPTLGAKKGLYDNKFYSNSFLKDHTININRFNKYERFK